ncbi:MAG: hypothetical protein IKJ72_00565, partial [Mycoplasmataceae bacterium]|nr:hypothetical protein [Mycoplasmataceae bacterium]
MGLRDWIKKIFSKRFGVKQISAGEAENTAGVMHETYGQNIFDELKVNGVPQIDKMKVEEIDKTAREVLKESAEKFKNTILSNEEIKKLKEESAKSGKMGDSPFICTVEMDANGEFKTTVIVKENSCAKIKEDKDGNLTYQETRIDGKEMKTIINTKDSSILITGNVSQNDIDKVQKFSNRNKATITQLKDFGEKNEEYKKLLESLGIKADIDLADKDSYMFSSTGRIIRDQNRKLKKLEEMGIVLDKKHPEKDPLIVSFNTYEKTIVKEGDKDVEKVVEKGRKFYLTKDGKYIEEGSIKFNDKGEPEFKEYTMKDLEELAINKTLDKKFIDKMKKINRDNVDLIP